MNELRDELAMLGGGAHALASQILGNSDDAADVVQDALAAVLGRPDAYRPELGRLRPWFLQVVRNRCIDQLRRRKPTDDTVDRLENPQDGPEQAAEAAERDRLVHRALSGLDSEKRQILVLRDYMDLNYGEIAEVLGVPKGTVMSRLHRARVAFGNAYREYDER